MLSIVPTSLEVSSTSTSTSPRVQTTQPSLSLQMVLQMKFAIIRIDRKSTRLNSSHLGISYAVFCLKKKKIAIVTAAVRSGRILGLVRRRRRLALQRLAGGTRALDIVFCAELSFDGQRGVAMDTTEY